MVDAGLRILLVEDDELDVKSVTRALSQADLNHEVIVARDGVEALEKLRGEEPLRGPLLILLDLSMPRMNGFEFLQALRADPSLHHHVVFVLTDSKNAQDRAAAYQKHIAGYMKKNHMSHHFDGVVGLLDSYAQTVVLPER